jgi:tRNA threonylcarbamoyladenosine biosynthesis protein TsaB
MVLETSGRRGLVAVADGDRVLAARALDESRRNARDLAPALAELLAAAGWRARQLEAVYVSVGPGSYTGLRVGVMSAKALAYATGCALIGVETFAAIARQALSSCERLDVIADAQKDNVYLQSFLREGDAWRPAGPLSITAFADWLKGRDPLSWVSGPGLAKYGDRLPADVRCVAAEQREPGVEALLALGLARYRADERDDPFTLGPIYLRASSAEQQWPAKA